MSDIDSIKKIVLYHKDKTGFVKEPTMREVTDVLVMLMGRQNLIDKSN